LRISVDEKYFQYVGMYIFGKKWKNDFISSDRTWVLYIYSPNLSKSLKEAKAKDDLMEMRRLTYWALTQPTNNDYLDRLYFKNCKIPNFTDGYGGRLQKNVSAENEGVTVYLCSDKDTISFESIQFASISRNGCIDAYYPVDINLFEENGKPSLGNNYYRNYDFKGTFVETSVSASYLTKGQGLIYGYLKGFGYTEYIYKNMSFDSIATPFAWSLPTSSVGAITGKYVGTSIPAPSNFSGVGETDFFGASLFQLEKWRGYNNKQKKKVTWRGETAGVGISIPINYLKNIHKWLTFIFTPAETISKGTIETYTTIIFPEIKPETKNILKQYDDQDD
jgi:hypothetical protein